jgi:hypothetical protein
MRCDASDQILTRLSRHHRHDDAASGCSASGCARAGRDRRLLKYPLQVVVARTRVGDDPIVTLSPGHPRDPRGTAHPVSTRSPRRASCSARGGATWPQRGAAPRSILRARVVCDLRAPGPCAVSRRTSDVGKHRAQHGGVPAGSHHPRVVQHPHGYRPEAGSSTPRRCVRRRGLVTGSREIEAGP